VTGTTSEEQNHRLNVIQIAADCLWPTTPWCPHCIEACALESRNIPYLWV